METNMNPLTESVTKIMNSFDAEDKVISRGIQNVRRMLDTHEVKCELERQALWIYLRQLFERQKENNSLRAEVIEMIKNGSWR